MWCGSVLLFLYSIWIASSANWDPGECVPVCVAAITCNPFSCCTAGCLETGSPQPERTRSWRSSDGLRSLNWEEPDQNQSWEVQRTVYVLNRWPPWFHVKWINVEMRVNRFYKHHININFPHQHSTIILNDFTSLENHFIIFSVFNLTTALQQSANRETHGLLGN